MALAKFSKQGGCPCAEHPFSSPRIRLHFFVCFSVFSSPAPRGLLSPPPSLSTILAPVPPTVEIKLFVPLARFTRRVEPRFTARCCLEQSVEHLKGTGQGQILGAPRSVHECPHGYLDIGVQPRPLRIR